MIAKEKEEAKTFRKNCHMARAMDKCGWNCTLCSYAKGVPSITGVTTTEICRFHSKFRFQTHSFKKYLLLSWNRVNESQRNDLYINNQSWHHILLWYMQPKVTFLTAVFYHFKTIHIFKTKTSIQELRKLVHFDKLPKLQHI